MRSFKGVNGLIILVLAMISAATALAQLSSKDIEQLEIRARQENWTFSVGENPATQYPLEQLCGLKIPDNPQDESLFGNIKADRDLPAAFDWRDSTGCPPVKNQGGCGSCWAFGTVGALECNILIKDGLTVDLSEQWLVSCNQDGYDCEGGWWAHDYHQWKTDPCGGFGAVMEEDFPYTATNGTCNCPYDHYYTIDSWGYIGNSYSIPSVSAMKQAILDYGPISVAVYANSAMQAYTGGIFNGCASGTVNHGVVLVGWDDSQGTSGVWIMRNSWGTGWGEEGGYMRMEYGCSSIGYGASYVVYTGYGALAFDYPDGIPESVTPGQAETFSVVVSGISTGQPVSGTGQLHYSINGDPIQTVAMDEISPNNYEAVLPVLSCYDRIEFYVSAEEMTSGVFYDPDPSLPHMAAAATEVISVFTDNFETDKGWTVTGDAADGQWNRGIPAGGGERGDPPTDYDGSGQCYLTDNEYGNSDVDDGTTNLISPVFAVPAGDALVHYARWYSNDFGADPNNDEMNVYISNDGGVNWTLVETIGPVEQAYGGWYKYSFWISDLITPTTTMKLKFEASDLNSGSVVEAGVDDIVIKVFVCDSNQPIIMTDSLPNWTAGMPYSQQLEATSGTGQYTWSDKYNNLAGTGLSLSDSGLISGTPTVSGLHVFTAVVTDEASAFDEKILSIQVNAALQITTDILPDWTAGVTYNKTLQVSGGTSPLSWSDKSNDLTGSGFTLSTAGVLSGMPVAAGTVSFTAAVSDQIGAVDEQLLSFAVNESLEITTVSLPDWTAGVFFTQMLQATGGTAPLTWSDKNSSLAGTGLTLTAAGRLSGTSSIARQIIFTAQLADGVGDIEEVPFIFIINPAVSILSENLLPATAGFDYDFPLVITGGTGEVIVTDLNGDLEGTGLEIASDGLISGTPLSSGQATFTVHAVDSIGSSDEEIFTLTINAPVTIATESLPDGLQGEAYSVQIEAGGGTDPLTWTDKNGDLEETGLILSEEGLLEGTPTISGEIECTILVEDIYGSQDEKGYTINIAAPFICGDANDDESINVLDATYLIKYLYSEGAAPNPAESADVNSSGAINILDVTYLLNYLYTSGGAPYCP
nr:choice-of-anchor J domain-containing protein [candidate division Zixibacteria bacterium]